MTLLTIREASQLIGRTPATIRRYIRSGRLKAGKELGKFGEEYKIAREDLLALGFSPSSSDLPARIEPAVPVAATLLNEAMVPASVFNDLLMKHEQLLVQYGMIRAGGQKLLEYKADAEAKEEDLRRAAERYQSLRARAAQELKRLRRELRQAEIAIEDRNIEITILQEKVTMSERSAASAGAVESFDAKVVEIRQKERAIAQMEVAEPRRPPSYTPPEAWLKPFSSDDRGEDH